MKKLKCIYVQNREFSFPLINIRANNMPKFKLIKIKNQFHLIFSIIYNIKILLINIFFFKKTIFNGL